MPPLTPPYDAVLLGGTVGAGKTTTAHALSALELAHGRRHAVVDLDEVRLLRPPPPDDRFAHEIELANLRDLARNFRAAGATRLVLAVSWRRRARSPATWTRWTARRCCCAG